MKRYDPRKKPSMQLPPFVRGEIWALYCETRKDLESAVKGARVTFEEFVATFIL